MLIDINTHLGRIANLDYSADALTDYVTQCNVDIALVSHGDSNSSGETLDEVDANRQCLQTCEKVSHLQPMYWVRPGNFDSNPQTFAGAFRREPFVGAVFNPGLHGYQLNDIDRLSPYMDHLAQSQIPAIIALNTETPISAGHLYSLARRWPRLPFVITGVFKYIGRSEIIDAVSSANNRKDAQLFLEISHGDIDDIKRTASAVSADRLLFGSDACRNGNNAVDITKKMLQLLTGAFSEPEFNRITYSTAKRIFRLQLTGG